MEYIIELIDNCLRQDKIKILSNITWRIKKGEHWALLGPNGSGKTTLLRIISGYLWPSSGIVKVLGKEFGKTDLRELRKKIGLVSSYLTERIPVNEKTIDVVISGKHASFGVYSKITKKDIKKAESILIFLGCFYVKDKKFNILSQGEKQKVLIARALIADPLLLILDEPCIGLDIKARKNLLAAVSKICKSKATLIYVTHHFEEIVPEIQNVIMTKKGRVFLHGNKEKNLNEKNIQKLFT